MRFGNNGEVDFVLYCILYFYTLYLDRLPIVRN